MGPRAHRRCGLPALGASLAPPRPAAPPSGSGAPRPPGAESGFPGPWTRWGESSEGPLDGSLDGERRGRRGQGCKGLALRAPRRPHVPRRRGRPPPLQPGQSPANFFRRCEGDFLNSGAYLIVAAEGGPRGHGDLGRERVSAGPPARPARGRGRPAGARPHLAGMSWPSRGHAPHVHNSARTKRGTGQLPTSHGSRPGQARPPAVTSHRPRDVTQRPAGRKQPADPAPSPCLHDAHPAAQPVSAELGPARLTPRGSGVSQAW